MVVRAVGLREEAMAREDWGGAEAVVMAVVGWAMAGRMVVEGLVEVKEARAAVVDGVMAVGEVAARETAAGKREEGMEKAVVVWAEA